MNKRILISLLVLGLLLVLAAGLTQAQAPDTSADSTNVEQRMYVTAAVVDNTIPLQGRLTDDGGNPLDGSYTVRFRLYDDAETVVCEDTHSVNVNDGLFNTTMDGCTPTDVNGQQLYLGIKVGTDAEMTDRQPIYPVPYAMSMRPGAIVQDDHSYVEFNRYEPSSFFVFTRKYGVYASAEGGAFAVAGVRGEGDYAGVSGYSESGYGVDGASYSSVGVRGTSTSDTGVYGAAYHESDLTYGVYGRSASSQGKGVYGYGASESGGIGVEGLSEIGSGVYGHSPEGYGVYGETDAASKNYGLFTPDNLYSANIHTSGAVMQVMQNVGDTILEPGAIVAFAGIEKPLEPGGLPTIRVVEATSANSTAVAGVVHGRCSPEAMAANAEKPNSEATLEGPVQPGDYLLVVVQGPAQVKASAFSAAIQPGDLLSSADQAGCAAQAVEMTFGPVKTAVPGTVLGKALEPLAEGEALIYVYVTLQ